MKAPMIDFQDCTLLITARSPFARRVRLAFLENGIRFEERLFDVFKPTEELIAANPLARVPAVILKSGGKIVDSHEILKVFYASFESKLAPWTAEDLLDCAYWSGLGVGLADKIVEYFLDTQRPIGAQDPDLGIELGQMAERILRQLEEQLGERESTLIACGLTQADLDVGTALVYLKLRYPKVEFARFPRLERYLERLQGRESFRKTVPPPA